MQNKKRDFSKKFQTVDKAPRSLQFKRLMKPVGSGRKSPEQLLPVSQQSAAPTLLLRNGFHRKP